VKRLQHQQRRQLRKVAEHACERGKQEQLQAQAAREGHRAAVRRLQAASTAVQTTTKMMDAGAAEQVEARKRAVAELHASVAAVHADMRTRADLYRCGALQRIQYSSVSLGRAFRRPDISLRSCDKHAVMPLAGLDLHLRRSASTWNSMSFWRQARIPMQLQDNEKSRGQSNVSDKALCKLYEPAKIESQRS
jgi:hypothetical protein